MLRLFLFYILSFSFIISGIVFAGPPAGQDRPEDLPVFPEKISGSAEKDSLFYQKGDWEKYIVSPQYRDAGSKIGKMNLYRGDNTSVSTYGSVNLKLKYGKSMFTDSKYKQYDEDVPQSRVVAEGFTPEQVILLHMEGDIGERISLYIDHDSRRLDNRYRMQYRALYDDEVIREINAGEIDIKFNHSRYAVYDSGDSKALGADFKIRKGDFEIKAFAAVSRGETAVEYFKGNSSSSGIALCDYQFVRRTYYQLEPFIRYDGLSSAPSGSAVYSTVTLTSAPASPDTYSLTTVGIESSGFAVYMDDQNQYNNYNAVQLSLDGGYYTKLSNGTDYSINYSTGVITFLSPVSERSRIFVVYNVAGGTRDPCALSPSDPNHPGGDFSGKNLVFIKYGYSINEDTASKDFVFNSDEIDANNDGHVNLDIYEIRSFYYLGAKQIVSSGFSLGFYKQSQRLADSDTQKLTGYTLDLNNGLISFKTREPFRALLDSDSADDVYSEVFLSDVYLESEYKIKSDFSVEARSFQLKNSNVIENSVKVKINGSELVKSLYSVDCTSGFIEFTDPNNPVIGSETDIEIKYEYLPFGAGSNEFMGGVRTDYEINKNLRIGGTLLVSKGAEDQIIPDAGDESGRTVMMEGDAGLFLDRRSLARMYNMATGSRKRTLPFEVRAYGEYARSIRQVNSFGKALIDNMESADEIVSLSLSEKDWILSSMPEGFSQSDRGKLYYSYYRNPSSPETLQGVSFSAYDIDYGTKPGPYNIAMGHVDDSITDQDSQKSLVLDFDFSSGSCVSVANRRFSGSSVDLSGLQYVEVWVKYEGASSGDSVNLYMDLGSIDEDSDGDGTLDNEDANSNGYIDSEPSSGYSEDRGYSFDGNNSTVIGSGPGLSSSTKGDGILNSEDLNGNGTLDGTENVYTISLGSVNTNGGKWQKIRFYIDWSSLSSAETALLTATESLRFYLTQGTGSTGKIYIDAMKLIASRWKNPMLDGSDTDSPDRIKTTLVNSIDDSDYTTDSFLINQKSLYESLYGDVDSDDLDSTSESALQVEFDIPGVNDNVSVKRTFSKVIDMRFYKTLNVWVNARVFSASNTLGIVIGSSDYDYIEYRAVPDNNQVWQKFSLALSGSESGKTGKYAVTGEPDMKRISYMKVLVYGAGTSGTVWLNEIYVSDPEDQEGSAYWYEGEVKFTRPLYRTASGTPILSDMNIKYLYRGNSSQFSSIGKTGTDMSEKYREISGNTEVLPHWSTGITWSEEKTRTDSLNEAVSDEMRGETRRENLMFTSSFMPGEKGLPAVSLSYNYYDYSQKTGETVEGSGYDEKNMKSVHTPVLSYRQSFADFLSGRLNARAFLNMVFTSSRVKRKSDDLSDSALAAYVDTRESEKRQRADAQLFAEYSNDYFFINNRIDLSSEEIVEISGSDKYEESGVWGELGGGFHVPFARESSMKYVERKNGGQIALGLKGKRLIAPSLNFSLSSRDNGFLDLDGDVYTSGEKYMRTKDSVTSMTSGINVPVELKRFDIFKNISRFNIGYSRSLSLTETDVPYEGEGTDFFSEKYGFSRVFGSLSPGAYGFIGKYPGYFFRGRGNSGAGRDYIYSTLNSGLDTGTSCCDEYDNSLKLVDSFTADMSLSAARFDVSVNAGLSQICERSNIYGVPGQVITATGGTRIQFDLMKIFNFWFFRPNRSGAAYHSSNLNLGMNCTENMIITSNIRERTISPSAGVVFKWERTSLGLKGSLDYRKREDHEYIDYELEEGDSDYIYIENMADQGDLSEEDYGYKMSALFETEVKWVYDYFNSFYKLSGMPVFSMEYAMEFNRYDYLNSVSPEPYDMFSLKSNMVLNLHKNVRGGMSGLLVLEKFRNRENNGISSEVLSYEISADFSLVF